jgi:hypothetical protein
MAQSGILAINSHNISDDELWKADMHKSVIK